VIAYKSTGDEIVMLRSAFEHYDTEEDGYISYEEFRAALKDCRIDGATLNKTFRSIDVSQDGKISYCEFLAAVLDARSNIEEERVADCFDHLDKSDTGYISKEDLASFLGQDSNSEKIKQLIYEADTDKDGQSKFVTQSFS
jgi:calcium-dependent protein kinase